MAVKLRLMRMGKKKQPTYRLVAADARSPRNGRFIEILGFYDPRSEPSTIQIDNDKAVNWLREGAQPTERVEKLLKISGAWTEFTGEAPPPTITRAGAATDEAPAEEASAEEAPAEEAPAEDAPADNAPAAEASADAAADAEPDRSAEDDSAAEDDTAAEDEAAKAEAASEEPEADAEESEESQ